MVRDSSGGIVLVGSKPLGRISCVLQVELLAVLQGLEAASEKVGRFIPLSATSCWH